MEACASECLFCRLRDSDELVSDLELVYCIRDKSPVTKGHLLIVTKRHVASFFELTEDEVLQAYSLLNYMKSCLEKNDKTISAFNVGINCGVSAGQTIMHAHIHLIPRRDGDISNPRGGVRGVIPSKRSY